MFYGILAIAFAFITLNYYVHLTKEWGESPMRALLSSMGFSVITIGVSCAILGGAMYASGWCMANS